MLKTHGKTGPDRNRDESPDLDLEQQPGYWQDYADKVDRILSAQLDNQQVTEQISRAMYELYEQLQHSLLFNAAMTRIMQNNRNSYCQTEILINHPRIRASLINTSRKNPIALHDHPGASGTTLILSGALKVSYCEKVRQHAPGQDYIRMISEAVRHEGEVCWFRSHERNIHGLQAIKDNCLELTIHTPAFDHQEQSYYFVTDNQLEYNQEVLAQRMPVYALRARKQDQETR